MSKIIKVRADHAGFKFITPGKSYEAHVRPEDPDTAYITDDGGARIMIRISGCAFLNYTPWEILPEGPSMEDELAGALSLVSKMGLCWCGRENSNTAVIGHTAECVNAKSVIAKYKESKQ